jgi:DNA-binding NtrC family response regulator
MKSNFDESKLNMHRAFVVDDQTDILQFVTATLAEHGLNVEGFATAKTALAALGNDHPAIVFLDVALLHSDAIDVLIGLGAQDYCGVVYLMSAGRPQLIEAVKRLGARHGVRLAPPLSKPVARMDLLQAVAGMKSHIAAPRPQRAASRA